MEEMRAEGLQQNTRTQELLVESAVVAADMPRMMEALQVLALPPHPPPPARAHIGRPL